MPLMQPGVAQNDLRKHDFFDYIRQRAVRYYRKRNGFGLLRRGDDQARAAPGLDRQIRGSERGRIPNVHFQQIPVDDLGLWHRPERPVCAASPWGMVAHGAASRHGRIYYRRGSLMRGRAGPGALSAFVFVLVGA